MYYAFLQSMIVEAFCPKMLDTLQFDSDKKAIKHGKKIKAHRIYEIESMQAERTKRLVWSAKGW